MQLREGSFPGPRPACPQDPTQPLHRHGTYERYAHCDGQQCLRIARFRCPRCGRTFSVLPPDRLPYRAVTTPRVEADFDARASGTDPPPTGEKERGCLRRAWQRFASRVAPLCAWLGQMIGPIQPSPSECWRSLRRWDNLVGILRLLATKFNTSLLGEYRCCRKPGF